MEDILSRIAAFARDAAPATPPVQTTSTTTKCPTSTDFVKTAVVELSSLDCLQTRVSVKSALLCFSKDRPFQLEQFLISSKSFLSLGENASKIFVLYSPGRYFPPIATSMQFSLRST